jgi:RimJ/RimL family protein N-acetyltransferase
MRIAHDPEIWTWMSAHPDSVESMADWIRAALEAEQQGREYPFAIFDHGGELLGSTRYMEVQARDRGVEIGWTWYAPPYWGTTVNPESKYILLRHAFEEWGAIRVALKTDVMNVHSQAAIRKLGARFEGVLRQHRIRRDGTYRDTVMFSILDSEWPQVRDGLLRRINLPKTGASADQ